MGALGFSVLQFWLFFRTVFVPKDFSLSVYLRFLALGEFFFAVLGDFFFGFAVSNIPQCPPFYIFPLSCLLRLFYCLKFPRILPHGIFS